MAGAPTTGFLLGKFLPPHRGHQYLIEFARNYVDRLTVLVCTIAQEPIPGHLRYQWMCEAFPGVDLVHHTAELPQAPEEHPQFWDIWRASIRRHVPGRIDYVFASEDYGERLATELGARFVPVDRGRRNVPVSGRAIRQDPMAHWDELLPPVRPYYLKRVCVCDFGGSGLAERLAARFGTVCVHAYEPGATDRDALMRAFRGQMAAEDALARQANRVLICAADAVTLAAMAESSRGGCPEEIAAAARRCCDLYLLVAGADGPYDPRDRLAAALATRGLPLVRLHGLHDAQLRQACESVDAMLRAGRR